MHQSLKFCYYYIFSSCFCCCVSNSPCLVIIQGQTYSFQFIVNIQFMFYNFSGYQTVSCRQNFLEIAIYRIWKEIKEVKDSSHSLDNKASSGYYENRRSQICLVHVKVESMKTELKKILGSILISGKYNAINRIQNQKTNLPFLRSRTHDDGRPSHFLKGNSHHGRTSGKVD